MSKNLQSIPSTNSKYKLTYFDVKGLGEPIRLLLSYGKFDFEDIRITFDQWPALKPTMPLAQMPVLDIDGVRVYQSISIARYLGKMIGLAGENDWESFQIDIIVDSINDIRTQITKNYYEPESTSKQTTYNTLINEKIPIYFNKFETIVNENNGYFALSKLTWADLYFAGVYEYINGMLKFDILEKYPAVKELMNRVFALEPIKVWRKNRPVTNL